MLCRQWHTQACDARFCSTGKALSTDAAFIQAARHGAQPQFTRCSLASLRCRAEPGRGTLVPVLHHTPSRQRSSLERALAFPRPPCAAWAPLARPSPWCSRRARPQQARAHGVSPRSGHGPRPAARGRAEPARTCPRRHCLRRLTGRHTRSWPPRVFALNHPWRRRTHALRLSSTQPLAPCGLRRSTSPTTIRWPYVRTEALPCAQPERDRRTPCNSAAAAQRNSARRERRLYFKAATNPAYSNVWMLYLEVRRVTPPPGPRTRIASSCRLTYPTAPSYQKGGDWCYDLNSCNSRYQNVPQYASSKKWQQARRGTPHAARSRPLRAAHPRTPSSHLRRSTKSSAGSLRTTR